MLRGLSVPMRNSKQMQWMVGLDYSLADNAWLSLNFGMITVKNEYNAASLIDADGNVSSEKLEAAYNLPSYANIDASGKCTHEFSQTVIEASINVEF